MTQDVGSDPTVGLPEFCTLCGQEILCYICEQEMVQGFASLQLRPLNERSANVVEEEEGKKE